MILKVLICLYFVINTVILIGIINQKDIIDDGMHMWGKLLHYFLILIAGILVILLLVSFHLSKPLYIRYKWIQRQKKIRKVILKEKDRNTPKDPIVGIF